MLVASVLWELSVVPGVAAEEVCYTTYDGILRCTTRLPYAARIAIGASIAGSILLSLALYFILRGRRTRQRAEIAAVYQVDAAQIHGPSTTYATSFDPRSAIATYPQTPGIVVSAAPESPPRGNYPVSPQPHSSQSSQSRNDYSSQSRYGPKPPQTAPVNQGYGGGYPFPGYSPKVPVAQPYTSFSSGFPRPLYTGHPVSKDGPKEVHSHVV